MYFPLLQFGSTHFEGENSCSKTCEHVKMWGILSCSSTDSLWWLPSLSVWVSQKWTIQCGKGKYPQMEVMLTVDTAKFFTTTTVSHLGLMLAILPWLCICFIQHQKRTLPPTHLLGLKTNIQCDLMLHTQCRLTFKNDIIKMMCSCGLLWKACVRQLSSCPVI